MRETQMSEENNNIRTEGDDETGFMGKNNSPIIHKYSINTLVNSSSIPKDHLNKNDDKINQLERNVQNLTIRGKDITKTLETLRQEKVEGKLLKRDISTSIVDKIKNENLVLKSDNIIYREEINKLSEMNSHFESELVKQRNRKYNYYKSVSSLLQKLKNYFKRKLIRIMKWRR